MEPDPTLRERAEAREVIAAKLYASWGWRSGRDKAAIEADAILAALDEAGIYCGRLEQEAEWCPSHGVVGLGDLAIKLHSTPDAWVWTQEFCARFSLFSEDGVVEDPHGVMLGWFANAIETGRTFAEKGNTEPA